MTEAETGKRPKPIELVARAIYGDWAWGTAPDTDAEAEARTAKDESEGHFDYGPHVSRETMLRDARAAFDILIKHGCISIEGIIARDEELARVAPVPERAGET